ncbi:MAG: M28 family peptidase [Planctomycetes bacterium]|nr:M28 family peptidase [Planctomycetota bacterium]
MRAWILVGVVALLPSCAVVHRGVATPAQEAPVAPRGTARERALVAGVDEARAQRTVRELVALGPRMGGTDSGDAAAEFLRAAFAELGLATRVLDDSTRWCHQEAGWTVALEWTDAAGEAQRRALASAWPYGFSPTSSGRAPLGLEVVAGGAQLSTRNPRPKKELAVALVDGHSTADGKYTRVQHLRRGDQNTVPVFGLGSEDGAAARALLAAGTPVDVVWSLEATLREAAPKTVEARLLPRAGAEPGYFVVCAHGDSDSGGPGADDNASGVAVVLEMARAWCAAIAEDEAARPAREVRFVVWGSEIHSTNDYLARATDGEVPLLGVVNFDQAGFGSGADQLNVEPDDLPANAGLVRAAASVLADFAGSAGFPARWATNKSLGGTDSYVFSSSTYFRDGARPAVTLFTSAWDKPEEHPRTADMPGESWSERDVVSVDYDAYYHSSGDTPANTTDTEPWNMGWCARVGLLVVDRWLGR